MSGRRSVLLGGLLLLLLLLGGRTVAAHQKVPDTNPFEVPAAQSATPAPVTPALAITTPARSPTPAPGAPASSITPDRFVIGLVLVSIGVLGATLTMIGLRRARRFARTAAPDKAPPRR